MNLNLYDIMMSVLNESIDQQSVIDAIQNKKVVAITYNDEQPNPPLGTRWIEPCSLVDMGNGKYGIRAYAYNGATRRGVPDWKLFRLDRIQSWKPTTSSFAFAPDDRFNPNGDKQYRVIAQVQFGKDSEMLQRNLKLDTDKNKNKNVDYFGRYVTQPKKQNKQGPVGTPPNMNQNQQQSGPIETQAMKKARQDAWRKKHDLEYRRARRERERAEKLRKQAFGDEEDEMMANFDKGAFFPNNNV